MDAVVWAAVAVIVVGGAALLALTRFVVRRETAAVPVLVSGEVPPAPEWLPTVLRDSAPTTTDHWSWSPVEEAGILSGFRGEVRLPGQGVALATTLQAHTHAGSFSSSRPLRVLVDLVDFPRRPGPSRLLLGRYPVKSALEARADLQRRIRDQARSVGAQARAARPLRATAVAALGGSVLLLALVTLVATHPEVWPNEPGAASTARPARAAPPASATRCPAPARATRAPTRSASGNRATGCALAETVRLAYVKRDAVGKSVTLTRVPRPKSKDTYDLTCKGTALVTCTSGKIIVYLF